MQQSESVRRFPCSQCGALLTYQPGTQTLVCRHCSKENRLEGGTEEIREYALDRALAELAEAKPSAPIAQIQCENCGAGFKFGGSQNAGECPFCGTPIVESTGEAKPISPKSLLPFKITQGQAREQFRRWLNGLWFAPNKVKKYAGDDAKLKGIYIPYWTFDSETETEYSGARGDIYSVAEHVQTVRNGQVVNETRQVPQIRWLPVRGRVARHFDDVLVGASKSLPRQILDRLEPWDLANLVPYEPGYLSGFDSEFYQVDLGQGFDEAKNKMEAVIYRDIAFDIGGDQQRIDHFSTRHNHNTFKHCLLPVWSAAFRYQQQSYHFIINGRTGQVQGERPYSYWKIAFAVLVGVLALAGILYLMDTASTGSSNISFRFNG